MKYISNSEENKTTLLNRFLRYVKTWTESNSEQADKGIIPSTPQQWDLAKKLLAELKEIGIQDSCLTDECYVYGYLPGKGEPLLFLAHMDTSEEVSGKNVNPIIEGDIIKTDGTTLLGADDKAGISAIMSALEYLLKHPEIEHCPIEVIFSPDEETGHGMDKVPLDLIKSKYAYTVDGGEEGEMETECFNAWGCTVEFTGKACHTGTAMEGGMINANLMLSDFISKLPKEKRPETTHSYKGFIAVMKTFGTIEKASADLLLRAFFRDEIQEEKRIIEKAAMQTKEQFGGNVQVFFNQQYVNMKEKLDENPHIIQRLQKAYDDSDVKIIRKPIRGGTDGSRLTELGIPTPNIFTGGQNFHSREEFVSLNSMAKAADVLLNLVIQK